MLLRLNVTLYLFRASVVKSTNVMPRYPINCIKPVRLLIRFSCFVFLGDNVTSLKYATVAPTTTSKFLKFSFCDIFCQNNQSSSGTFSNLIRLIMDVFTVEPLNVATFFKLNSLLDRLSGLNNRSPQFSNFVYGLGVLYLTPLITEAFKFLQWIMYFSEMQSSRS